MTTSTTYYVTYASAGITRQPVPNKTPQEILEIFRQMYSELDKAEVVVTGDEVTFQLKDGNKAA